MRGTWKHQWLSALASNKVRVVTSWHLSLLHHSGLFLKFLFLLHTVSVDNIQGMLVSNQAILHVHIVYLIAVIGVLNGSPGFWDWRLETLNCDPQ